MNLNKGCIEIKAKRPDENITYKMNLNKGCIEIQYL